jgi:hypothetical protein
MLVIRSCVERIAASCVEGAQLLSEKPMPFKFSGGASRYRGEAVPAPDILLVIVAALSLWVLIVWAISSYL